MVRVAVAAEPRPAIDHQGAMAVEIDDLSLLCDEGCGANGAIFVPLRAGKEYPEKGRGVRHGHALHRFHGPFPPSAADPGNTGGS
jgi:hypothetical protein